MVYELRYHWLSMEELEEQLAALVPAAVAGTRRAMGRIMRLINPPVVRYTRSRIQGGRIPSAEDVAQEILLAVSQALPHYQDQGRPFMAFVYGIAANKVADAYRAMGRDHTSPTEEVPESADGGLTPEGVALVADGSNRVRALLDELSDKSREIMILRVFVGLSAEETAAIVGSTPGAVRVAQHRALRTLRGFYESGEQEHA